MSTVATPVKSGENLKVEIRRVIRASRQRVFEAWTQPEELRKWLAPGQMAVTLAQTKPRVGGSYRIEMQGSMEGKPEEADRRSSVFGVYTAIVPNELIVFTWRPDWNTEDESRVTVRLRDVENGTEMVLTHELIASGQSCTGYQGGWNSCIAKLAGYLEN